MPDSEQLLLLPAHEQAQFIRRGDLSPRDLVESQLARILKVDPFLNAYASVYEREALAASDLASAQAAEGRFLSPLHGVTVAVKDNFDIVGRVTTAGSRSRENVIAKATALAVERLVAAGVIVLGKTNTVEFAYGSSGTNAQMGTPRNPWNHAEHYVPGGSSSGSGVAVAAGLASLALGSDTGGSVRIPASMCGIVGLKPTRGRVSTYGLVPLSRNLDSIGPMTRSVEDAGLLLAILAHRNFDGTTAPGLMDLQSMLTSMRAPIGKSKLAFPVRSQLEQIDPEVILNFDLALETFRTLGADVSEVSFPKSFFSCVEAMTTITSTDGYSEHGAWIEEHGDIDPFVRARLSLGKAISAADYLRTLRQREQDIAHFRTFFVDYDALLTPTTVMPAMAVANVNEDFSPLNRLTRPVSYLDLCALSVPSGFSSAGLPISLQIIGAPFDEIGILRLGLTFQGQTSWHTRYRSLPPIP